MSDLSNCENRSTKSLMIECFTFLILYLTLITHRLKWHYVMFCHIPFNPQNWQMIFWITKKSVSCYISLRRCGHCHHRITPDPF